jgi:hypothetical protein
VTTLAQELAEDQRLGSSCHICAFTRSLPVAEQSEWHTELSKPADIVSHMSILRALQRRQVEVSESSVKRHRRNHA